MDIWTVGLFFGPFFGTSLRKGLMTSFLYQRWRGARVVIITIFLGRVRNVALGEGEFCLLYTSPSPRDGLLSRMPSSA